MSVYITTAKILGANSSWDFSINSYCQILSSFNWAKVAEDLKESKYPCHSVNVVEVWIVELCRFFILKVIENDIHDVKLAPSESIEIAWKTLILHPADYLSLCCSLLQLPTGGPIVLDYNPRGKFHPERQSKYIATLETYRRLFCTEPGWPCWDSIQHVIDRAANFISCEPICESGGNSSECLTSTHNISNINRCVDTTNKKSLNSASVSVPGSALGNIVGQPQTNFKSDAELTCISLAKKIVSSHATEHINSTSNNLSLQSLEQIDYKTGASQKNIKRARVSKSIVSTNEIKSSELFVTASEEAAPKTGILAAVASPQTTQAAPGQMTVKIIDENLHGSCFTIAPTLKFEKLKRAFAEHTGRKEKEFMLYFNGWSLKKSQCVADVKMSDGDCIQVLPRRN
mmetsp:Transcript_21245/g.29455  ORF Transcript_21245/g.29455 Transcript_21245/m.29455 type:complete len:401 (+) Transcript_21245:81-1283(+)